MKRAEAVARIFSRRFQCEVKSLPGDRVEYTPDTVILRRADGSLVGYASRERPWFREAKRAKSGEGKR